MYVPLNCSLEQVVEFIKKQYPEAEYHPDDNLIEIKPYLEIRVTLSRILLQFKWISDPKADQIADALAFYINQLEHSNI